MDFSSFFLIGFKLKSFNISNQWDFVGFSPVFLIEIHCNIIQWWWGNISKPSNCIASFWTNFLVSSRMESRKKIPENLRNFKSETVRGRRNLINNLFMQMIRMMENVKSSKLSKCIEILRSFFSVWRFTFLKHTNSFVVVCLSKRIY